MQFELAQADVVSMQAVQIELKCKCSCIINYLFKENNLASCRLSALVMEQTIVNSLLQTKDEQ